MTHQTLLIATTLAAFSPASHFPHASSSPLLFTRSSSPSCSGSGSAPAMASFSAHHHGSLLEREGPVSSALALRSSLRPREAAAAAAEEVAAGPAACGGADRGVAVFVADEFFVEDLLDLEDLCEVDKDLAELEDAAPAPGAAVEDEDKLSSDSHESSSVVSYELMTLPVPPHQMMDLPLPAHDAEELEWVSRIMDDSLAELPPPPKLPAALLGAARRPLEAAGPMPHMQRSPTPTICALSTEARVPVKAKRSKRSRASVWSLSGGAPPLSESTAATSTSSTTTTSSSCTSSSASFSPLLLLPADSSCLLFLSSSPHFLLDETPPRPKKKKKSKQGKSGGKAKKRGRKPKHHPRPPQLAGGARTGAGAGSAPAQGDRRCSHCGVQKTPQWRAGPEGAKTLCNACGVRYKSGRLLPEYRPACSPTFVSSIHSNSHRKVLEMRRMKEDDVLGPLPLAPVPAALLGLGPAVASF